MYSGGIYGVEINNSRQVLRLTEKVSGTGSVVEVPLPTLEWGPWFHFAYVNDVSTNKIYVFINGQKGYEATNATSNSLQPCFASYSRGSCIYDELRISNVARWTSNFTPFADPYTSAGVAKYAINNTQDISGKQDTLVSGTNIKTVNNNSLLGSGNISIDSLPSQTGNSGKFLTTDGTDASWATVQGGSGASFLSGGSAPTSGTNADMAGQTYVNTTDGSLYVCQALTGGDPTTYYTVVGSPTINSSYVASNFGSNSYVDTGVTFRPSGAWNIKMKFNCSATSSNWYKLTGHTGNGVSIGVDNSKIKLECSSTGTGWDVCAFSGSTSIQAGRDYWIDFGFDGTNLYYVDLSTDGVAYTRDGSATSTKKVYSTATMGLGCAFSGYDSHYFVGSIYLPDFEIYEATELTYRAVSLGGPLWKSAASLAMPSAVYDDLTLGASGSEYTAPSNGYVYFSKSAGAEHNYISLQNKSTHLSIGEEATTSITGLQVFLPVLKGHVFIAGYNATGATDYFRFIYAEGSKSEAN